MLKWVVASWLLVTGALAWAGAPAQADPVPLSITPVHADAGYFLAAGTCPKGTSRLDYRWTGGVRATSRTRVTVRAGAFSQLLHVQAAAPGGTVQVTLRCQTSWGKTLATFDPVSLVSGQGTVPFSLTTLDADAGYFAVSGECPTGTGRIEFRWTGAANGEGYGQIVAAPGPFSEPLRMQAAEPGGTIEATVACQTKFGRTKAKFGPFTLASGTAMLPVPDNSGAGRRIVYSVSAQQLWAIEADGTVVHAHLVSGRRLALIRDRSQYGVFSVGYKKRFSCAKNICPNFVAFHREVTGWIGFHEIPRKGWRVYQKATELGQPRSSGCVRQSAEDAAWLYEWAQLGDTVVVVP